MPLLHPDAAGIDIGHREHWCAVPADRCQQPVRAFGTFTQDLEEMARWLQECGVKTVAMESTGVYWIPALQILERHGLEVFLVNARHVKNVFGRKTDIQDCQWLQRLHSFGLLNASFRPPDHICVLRSYLRYRDDLVGLRSMQSQPMQKALQQMNVPLHQVLSDVTGLSGTRIIEAILEGERDPEKLAALADKRVRASRATIQKALRGDYRPEHLFMLQTAFDLYQIYDQKIHLCDEQALAQMAQLPTQKSQPLPERKSLPQAHPRPGRRDGFARRVASVGRGGFDRHRRLRRAHGPSHPGRDRARRQPLAQRKAFHLLAGTLPGSPHQRGPSVEPPHPPCRQ